MHTQSCHLQSVNLSDLHYCYLSDYSGLNMEQYVDKKYGYSFSFIFFVWYTIFIANYTELISLGDDK